MPALERSAPERMAPPSRLGDKAFEWLTLAMALVVVLLVFLVGWQLARGSSLAIQKFGFNFLTTSTWDPVAEQFGALPFIYGTLVSSLIALFIAVPLSIATRGLPDRARSALDSPADYLAHRNARRRPQRDPRSLGHLRHDSLPARLSVSDLEKILRFADFSPVRFTA